MTIEKPASKRALSGTEAPESSALSSTHESLADRTAVDSLDEAIEQETSRLRPLIGLAEQIVIATIVGLSLLAIGGYYLASHARRGPWIEIEQAAPREIQFQIDLNRAEWSELSLLPGVGESLARRIIEDRDEHGAYTKLSQLTRVSGIGEKKLAAIKQYVLPLENDNEPRVAATGPE